MDALLTFSRANQPTDLQARASLRSAMAAVVEEFDLRLAQADATIDADIDDLEVHCAPALLHVLIANLVDNAVKFLRERPERRVRVTSRIVRGGCELQIEDSGPGIPDDVRERIFEPFFRVPGTAAAGTGIGLATVRRIVDACGGRITLDSTVGIGSSFRVWLPLAQNSLGVVGAPRIRAAATA
jgi:signal transduction histidine kinase